MDLKSGWWYSAFRKAVTGSILTNKETEFIIVKNTWRFCSMDSFVFSAKGGTYIFAELYDIILQRGTIGYAKWNGNSFGRWKQVIVQPYHMSYPFVFEKNGEIYMVPETHENRTVELYKAVDFPDKWEKIGEMISGVKYVDTTFFEHDGKRYAFTYDIENYEDSKLCLFEAEGEKIDVSSKKILSNEVSSARPGGYVFKRDEQLIRVSQDCLGSYGRGLVFSRIDSLDDYSETELERIYPDDLKFSKKLDMLGTHNYSSDGTFEAIDIKTIKFRPVELFFRLLYKIRKKIKK